MVAPEPGFNPSQVGYKPMQTITICDDAASFNPSQVGYKRLSHYGKAASH